MRNYCFFLLALGTRLAILMVCAPVFVYSKNSVTSPTVRSALSMVSVPIILKITYHTFSWQNHFLHESTQICHESTVVDGLHPPENTIRQKNKIKIIFKTSEVAKMGCYTRTPGSSPVVFRCKTLHRAALSFCCLQLRSFLQRV